MANEDNFLDFATVRDMLIDANERRGQLTYEQKAALQHAEWAASNARNGHVTRGEHFEQLRARLVAEVDVFARHPGLAAKVAELIPTHPEDIEAVLRSKRVKSDDRTNGDTDAILDIVRQVYSFEQ